MNKIYFLAKYHRSIKKPIEFQAILRISIPYKNRILLFFYSSMFSKKNKKKGFTLIEMLIVIVIIGILAAALIPRLSSARGRANDVARKADLSQIASALVVYQIDKGSFPTTAWSLSNISWNLIGAGMSSVPSDPNTSRANGWIDATIASWQYGYIPITKWWIAWNGFVVIAATETEWWSNRVAVNTISTTTDYNSIKLCKSFDSTCTPAPADSNWKCCYNKNSDQLRYIYVY